MGLVDAGRVGVRGHSYGGYAVVALLTQTNAFRAGVANAPTGVNMTSTYVANFNAMRWCEFSGGRTGGTPWEKRKRYIENSPFFLLDQVETPLMLVCGSKDEPAAMSARETFLALRRLGQARRNEGVPGANHTSWHGLLLILGTTMRANSGGSTSISRRT